MNMSYGKAGLSLTQSFEQCRLMPYQDSAGVWTDGWGNTHHVTPGMSISQDKADSDLLANVQDAVDTVNDTVSVDLTQNQFDALVDFVFNVGGGAFKASTLLKLLNGGDYDGASEQMDRWVRAGGVRLAGLARRRNAEQALFNDATPT